MSLTSSYELSQNPEFRGKVLMAVVKVARKVIDEGKEVEDGEARVTLAKSALANARGFADAVVIVVAGDDGIDSSSGDDAIQAAVLKAVVAMVS